MCRCGDPGCKMVTTDIYGDEKTLTKSFNAIKVTISPAFCMGTALIIKGKEEKVVYMVPTSFLNYPKTRLLYYLRWTVQFLFLLCKLSISSLFWMSKIVIREGLLINLWIACFSIYHITWDGCTTSRFQGITSLSTDDKMAMNRLCSNERKTAQHVHTFCRELWFESLHPVIVKEVDVLQSLSEPGSGMKNSALRKWYASY